MSKTVYQYRVRCTNDNIWEYTWRETEPTTCPTDTSHTIDPSATTIVDIITKNLVTVVEEQIPTNGNFQCTSLVITAGPNSTGSAGISWPYPTTALSVNFITNEENAGDSISMYGGKDTPIGVLTADTVGVANAWVNQNYTAGEIVTYNHPLYGERVYTCIQNTVSNDLPIDTTKFTAPANYPYWKHGYCLAVSSTVIENTFPGYEIRLKAGATNTYVGRVISVDKNLSHIYVENNLDYAYLASSPTLILQTIYFLKNYQIDKPWNRMIGESKIGGSYIPADVFIHGEYTNNGNTTKTLIGHVEYLY